MGSCNVEQSSSLVSGSRSPRILMFPWLGYGHITAYLELAKKLTTKGFFVYLCSTPATLTSIEKRITFSESKSITLVPLLLTSDDNDLPPHLHTTNGLPPHLMLKLKEAFHDSLDNFSAILSNLNPDLLIFDFLQPWAPSVAEALGIPSVIFITSSSVMTSFMFHHFKNHEHDTADSPFPFHIIRFRDYESRFMEELLNNAGDPAEREKGSIGVDKSRDIVLITGSGEIEGKYIDYVSGLVGKEFVPVGPLARDPTTSDDDVGGDHDVLSWLDKKEAKSTVFVSFGSEFFLSEGDMEQIARGLLLTNNNNVNFIWVVRFPKGVDGQMISASASLPQGFVKEVGDKGKIMNGWAPQTKILAHPSVGGFVSHCGWNSVMESIKYSVPIIAMPMHLDQPINARLVEEIGVGMEVLRESDGKLVGERLAAVINRVVVEAEGGIVRLKAATMKARLEAKGDQDIDHVAQKSETQQDYISPQINN